MDLMWLVYLLAFFVFVAVVYLIIAKLIMPVIPAPMQAVAWAIIGLVLLIAVVVFFAHYVPGHEHYLR